MTPLSVEVILPSKFKLFVVLAIWLVLGLLHFATFAGNRLSSVVITNGGNLIRAHRSFLQTNSHPVLEKRQRRFAGNMEIVEEELSDKEDEDKILNVAQIQGQWLPRHKRKIAEEAPAEPIPQPAPERVSLTGKLAQELDSPSKKTELQISAEAPPNSITSEEKVGRRTLQHFSGFIGKGAKRRGEESARD